jgi:DNA-binding NarL/FixJ family response regulator
LIDNRGTLSAANPPKRPRRIAAPRGLIADRITCEGEDIVVFSWNTDPVPRAALTSSERAVLALVLDGMGNAAIATARNTSARTIANQVASILRKTGASSRFDLIRRYAGASEDA